MRSQHLTVSIRQSHLRKAKVSFMRWVLASHRPGNEWIDFFDEMALNITSYHPNACSTRLHLCHASPRLGKTLNRELHNLALEGRTRETWGDTRRISEFRRPGDTAPPSLGTN